MKKLKIDNTFSVELPADPSRVNRPRQVEKACFSYVLPRVPSAPKVLHFSREMVEAIGLTAEDTTTEEFTKIFTGAIIPEGADPYAMYYGGHQFGHWAGQLGDGRAINIAEVVHEDQRWALQLKGSGLTPYSRTADGLAVLRSSVREHLCSEAMYHLGVPTTRSVSLAVTGDKVLRDMLYDGNAAYEKGAVICRAAPSFIRFGNFQILAAKGDAETLKKLTDYTIRHFYPGVEVGTKGGYVEFFRQVSERTLNMIVEWQRVGFVHGVMNTDNLSILGLTIDYGPYGWLEGYDENWTPNTTDSGHRRYRFGNQPGISLWNLAQLGNALMFLIEDPEPLQEIIENYKTAFASQYLAMMQKKLGLRLDSKEDSELIKKLTEVLQLTETDMTIFFRKLCNVTQGDAASAGTNGLSAVNDAFYQPEELTGEILTQWQKWFTSYARRLSVETIGPESRIKLMKKSNPKYVLRNYMAQLAIDKADTGDYSLIAELHELLKAPYAEQPEAEKWFARRPEWARDKVGCSMLSCSS